MEGRTPYQVFKAGLKDAKGAAKARKKGRGHFSLVSLLLLPQLFELRMRVDPQWILHRPELGVHRDLDVELDWLAPVTPILLQLPLDVVPTTGKYGDLALEQVPRELIESFGQAILPEHIPFWQILIFLAVLPGIVEELTFRGVLLHGVSRRFGPVRTCLVVGLVFGFFHFQIFRIPGTALLGVILAAVTLMTGSIFPAMLWHALNNALALYLGSSGIELGDDTWSVYVGGIVALALAFWIIWRNRTPYPGLEERALRPQPR